MKRQIEVLAPAGSMESLMAAVNAGADAVYMGGSRFGARAYAENPQEEQFLEAIDYAHLHGCRLYMTVNTLMKEAEMAELYDFLKPCYERGLDAVIVQDMGVFAFVRKYFPDLPVHASTQMTVTGPGMAQMLKEQGAARVVTARELSLEEIADIHRKVDIEIESFVHGALCYCYSGQCLMSSLIGGRSGNRGRCAQPCRLPYDLVSKSGDENSGEPRTGRNLSGREKQVQIGGKRAQASESRAQAGGKWMQASESRTPIGGKRAPIGRNRTRNQEKKMRGAGADEQYVLSLKDLCTLDILPDIVEAGVYSLKIEGRMKSPRYTAGVVSVYRKYVDLYLEKGRKGYRVDPADRKLLLDLFDRGGLTEGYYRQHNGRDMVALKEKPAFREANQALFDRLDEEYVNKKKQEPVWGTVYMTEGEPVRLELSAGRKKEGTWENAWSAGTEGGGISVMVEGARVQTAQNQPISEEKLLKQLRKTGNSPFYFEELGAVVEGSCFLPVQALNELRRQGLEQLAGAVLAPFRRRVEDAQSQPEQPETVQEPVWLEQPETVQEQTRPEQPETIQEQAKLEQPETIQEQVWPEQPEHLEASGMQNHSEQPETIQEQTRPESPEADNAQAHSQKLHPSPVHRPAIHVLLEDPETFPAVLAFSEVASVYLDSCGFGAESWKGAAESCHRAGKQCVLVMPHIFRTEARCYFTEHEEELRAAGFDEVLVKALEEAAFLKEHAIGLPMIFDANLYTMNRLAADWMRDAGAGRLTMPLELNYRELEQLVKDDAVRGTKLPSGADNVWSPAPSAAGRLSWEMVAYGHLPAMVSAQCVRRTRYGCTKQSGVLFMKDRTGKVLPVKNHCRFCYNTIYNPAPLSLLGQEQAVERLDPAVLRLQFSVEDPRQVRAVTEAYIQHFVYGNQVPAPFGEFTRGHLKRGVE